MMLMPLGQQAGVECTLTDKTSQKIVSRSHLPELEEVRVHEHAFKYED